MLRFVAICTLIKKKVLSLHPIWPSRDFGRKMKGEIEYEN